MTQEPTIELLLLAYSRAAFPMADPDTGEIEWYRPQRRGIIPLDSFHVPDSLAREVRKGRFEITNDTAFTEVMRACDSDRSGWNRSWINEDLIRAYTKLHEAGYAHSVEARLSGGAGKPGEPGRPGGLVGGLYGVHIGSAFFGESMFSRPERGGTNASKICLVHLVNHLRARGFTLLDTQFWNPHLAQFGCIEISHEEYERRLRGALAREVAWGAFAPTR